MFSVEPVQKLCAGNPGDADSQRVAPADDADIRIGDGQDLGYVWSQRHYHHEINDVDQLYHGCDPDDSSFLFHV
nr:hypothetical protein [Salidesulfovibrio onnuriiensis]